MKPTSTKQPYLCPRTGAHFEFRDLCFKIRVMEKKRIEKYGNTVFQSIVEQRNQFQDDRSKQFDNSDRTRNHNNPQSNSHVPRLEAAESMPMPMVTEATQPDEREILGLKDGACNPVILPSQQQNQALKQQNEYKISRGKIVLPLNKISFNHPKILDASQVQSKDQISASDAHVQRGKEKSQLIFGTSSTYVSRQQIGSKKGIFMKSQNAHNGSQSSGPRQASYDLSKDHASQLRATSNFMFPAVKPDIATTSFTQPTQGDEESPERSHEYYQQRLQTEPEGGPENLSLFDLQNRSTFFKPNSYQAGSMVRGSRKISQGGSRLRDSSSSKLGANLQQQQLPAGSRFSRLAGGGEGSKGRTLRMPDKQMKTRNYSNLPQRYQPGPPSKFEAQLKGLQYLPQIGKQPLPTRKKMHIRNYSQMQVHPNVRN